MEDDNYHYTEEDAEVALRFLRLHLPKYATPENAINVLIYCREKAKAIEELSSNEVEDFLVDFEEH